MARYMNKKNGRIATVIEEDKKYKTVLVRYEDDGSEQNVSASTLKRWWKHVEDEVDEDEEEVDDEDYEDIDGEEEEYEDEDDEEEVEDDTDEDGDDEEEEDTALKQTKQKATKTKQEKTKKSVEKKEKKERKPKKEKKPVFESADFQRYIINIAEKNGCEVCQRMKGDGSEMPLKVFKYGSHLAFDMGYSKVRVCVNVKPQDLKKHNADEEVNSFFKARFIFTEDTPALRKKVAEVIKDVVNGRRAALKEKEDK